MPCAPPSPSPCVQTLYVDHHAWLLGWLRKRVGNRPDAADLTQDTFLRLLRSGSTARIQDPRNYLSTIARGLAIDLYRRRSLERAYLDAMARMPKDQHPSPETQALLLEALVEADRMLDGLPSKVRHAFILSQVEGLTYREIAQAMGLSLRTINNYLARALEHCCLSRLRSQA